jgi:repressor LexA
MNLTPRQLDVIVAIRNYRHINGYAPTMQELADQLGTSKVTIFEHVGALERKRVLRRDKHKARSLEIISEEKLPDENRSTKLPLLGNIAAGSPIEAVDFVVIERRETAKNGEQVVALLDTGEATLKRFYKEGGKIRLQPANKTMEARIVDPDRLRIQGVVIGVLRTYN